MAMPQRDNTIEAIKRLDALLEYAVMHDDEKEAELLREELRMPKAPHFCYASAVTAYDRIFDAARESYGLVSTPMFRRWESHRGLLCT